MFHKEFQNYSHMFIGFNAEGLFAATVLHSLDHELMEWNLEDPLWLDVKDTRFGKMASRLCSTGARVLLQQIFQGIKSSLFRSSLLAGI